MVLIDLMKITVLQENLRSALSTVSRFTSQKSQLPVLGNILLKTNKSRLILSATNLETSVSTSIGAKIEKEGEVTVNGKILNDLVLNLSPGQIEIETEKEQIKILSGNFKSKILGMNSSDFPILPKETGENSFKLNSGDFINSLSKVLFAVSFDELRPILTGVLFIFEGNELSLVSTDGFRLTEIVMRGGMKFPDLKMIIPRAILNEISRFSDIEEIEVSFDEEKKQIIFGIGDTIFSSRTIEGQFPDYKKVIPEKQIAVIDVDREEFERAIRLASVFAKDSGKIVKLKILNNELLITAESSVSGSQEVKLEIKSEDLMGAEINIMFNYGFIEDVLKVMESDQVKIIIAPDNKACKFLDPKFPNFLHIIMPIESNRVHT